MSRDRQWSSPCGSSRHSAISTHRPSADYAALGGMRYLGRPKRLMLSIYAMASEETEYGEPLRLREDEPVVSQVLTGLSLTAHQVLGGWAG